jgi:hypothetical protein
MSKTSNMICIAVFLLVGLMMGISAQKADAAGVVGTGTLLSCTESAFDTALAGGGAVTFNCGGAATIIFTATKTITTATTISGGDVITLSGGNAVRLFNVTAGGLTLNNISLINGHDTVANPGAAAINASANVTITESTISGHHTTNGGCPAISMAGATLTIDRSTITGNINQASASGFAVCANNTATLNVNNSTLTDNTGGAISCSGTCSVTNSTVADNTSTGSGNTGGILAFGGTVTLHNTIVSNNAGTGQCATVSGSIVNGGHNLQFPDAACGAAITVADPQLGPLASNGGPTQTMALSADSPAIDTADSASFLPTDQRNVLRPQGAGPDIGAYEFVFPASVPAMSGWGMIVFMFLAGFGSVYYLRRRRGAED